jgi:hypothetical protein
MSVFASEFWKSFYFLGMGGQASEVNSGAISGSFAGTSSFNGLIDRLVFGQGHSGYYRWSSTVLARMRQPLRRRKSAPAPAPAPASKARIEEELIKAAALLEKQEEIVARIARIVEDGERQNERHMINMRRRAEQLALETRMKIAALQAAEEEEEELMLLIAA